MTGCESDHYLYADDPVIPFLLCVLAQLRAELADYKAGADEEARAGDEARESLALADADVETLREQVTQLTSAVRDLDHDNRGLLEVIDDWRESYAALETMKADEIAQLTSANERQAKVVSTVRWQAESYLTRARAELMPGVGLELCETALNHILDAAAPATSTGEA